MSGPPRLVLVFAAAVVSCAGLAAAAPIQATGSPAPPGAPEHQHEAPRESPQEGHQHPPAAPDGGTRSAPAAQEPRSAVPPVTEEDRAAAFPDVRGHTVHDQAIHYFVLFDELEAQTGGGTRAAWNTRGWVGRDEERIWFRSEGHVAGDRVADAGMHVLYGRAVAPWWDVVAGLRHDVRPGPSRSWLAIGLQGLAPYRFEVDATAYVGGGGRTIFRLEGEYELRLTNRWIAQPGVGVDLAGKADPERHVGAGLSAMDAGVRVRYEIRRELAPYAGVAWSRRFFDTARFAAAAGERETGWRAVGGLRLWF